jgi:hypothetical protein
VGSDVPVDSETLLVTDFVNLKIKPTQSFRYAHRSRVYVRMFIGVSAHTYMSICVCLYCISKKKRYVILYTSFPVQVETIYTFHVIAMMTFPFEPLINWKELLSGGQMFSNLTTLVLDEWCMAGLYPVAWFIQQAPLLENLYVTLRPVSTQNY